MLIEPPNTSCNQEIKANTDIGGPGVMASFLIMSWLTVLLAFVPALNEARNVVYQWHIRRNLNGKLGAAAAHPKPDLLQRKKALSPYSSTEPKAIKNIKTLFGLICDLQAVTGIAIMVAGFAQWNKITFYHAQLIMVYWLLTLESFWVARIHYMDIDSTGEPWLLFTRRFCILISCILATIWQIRVIYRESYYWDDYYGPCYRYLDGTSSVPWAVGQILFSVALASCLSEKTRFINHGYFHYTEKFRCKLLAWFESSRQACKDRRQKSRDPGKAQVVSHVLHTVWMHIELAIAALSIATYWVLLQWMDIWSYGNGFYPFAWVIHTGINTWNTLDVISLWALNKPLVSAEEQDWGFGQVLPLVLILSISINALDIFRGGMEADGAKTSARTDEIGMRGMV